MDDWKWEKSTRGEGSRSFPNETKLLSPSSWWWVLFFPLSNVTTKYNFLNDENNWSVLEKSRNQKKVFSSNGHAFCMHHSSSFFYFSSLHYFALLGSGLEKKVVCCALVSVVWILASEWMYLNLLCCRFLVVVKRMWLPPQYYTLLQKEIYYTYIERKDRDRERNRHHHHHKNCKCFCNKHETKKDKNTPRKKKSFV